MLAEFVNSKSSEKKLKKRRHKGMAATALYSTNTASAKLLSSARGLSNASKNAFKVNKTVSIRMY